MNRVMIRELQLNRARRLVALLPPAALSISLGCYDELPRAGNEDKGTRPKVTQPTVQYLASPNMPFSPRNFVALNVPDCMPARLTVYNVAGESLGVLLDSIICGYLELNVMEPRMVNRKASGVPDSYYRGAETSGIYYYTVEFPDTTVRDRMIVLR